jgi:hypothetical protein
MALCRGAYIQMALTAKFTQNIDTLMNNGTAMLYNLLGRVLSHVYTATTTDARLLLLKFAFAATSGVILNIYAFCPTPTYSQGQDEGFCRDQGNET